MSTSAAHPRTSPTDHDIGAPPPLDRVDQAEHERELERERERGIEREIDRDVERANTPLRAPAGAQKGAQKVPGMLPGLLSNLSTWSIVSTSAPTEWRISAAGGCAIAISALTFAAHFLLPAGTAQLVVPLLPLALLMVARHDNRRMQWAVIAGMLWIALAWAELIHPTAAPQVAIYRLVELTSLGMIFVQLFEAARFMQHLSQRDPLTSLLNRRGFEELSATELQRAARYDRPIAFALLDVDRFKSVNDQYGHAVGDRVLRIVSEELLKLRTSDIAVRLGGDEFGLLMPETDDIGAEQLVSRLRQRIHVRMFEQGFPVTISAGVASSASCRRRLPDLMAEADTRMYACKLAERA